MPEDSQREEIVVFRRWRMHPRNVVALFPGIRANLNSTYCMTYEAGGRMDEVDYRYAIKHSTVPVHPSQSRAAATLRRELEGMGFRLKVVTRRPHSLTPECRYGLTRGYGKPPEAPTKERCQHPRCGSPRTV